MRRVRAPGLALAVGVILVLAAGGPAGAQSTDPGDLPPVARPDSAGVTPPPGDTLRPPLADARDARGERRRPWHRKPWAIMARSAVVPGLGQWTNGRPVKALLVAGAEVAAGVRLADAFGETRDALARRDEALARGDEEAAAAAGADYDRAFESRSAWAWVVVTAVALSMLDAYVDAHLLQFDADFGPDPRLFDDDEGAGAGLRRPGDGPDVRVGFLVRFQGPTGR